MPLPLVPIGILWIIGVAAAIGVLAGLLAFFMSQEGTVAILVVLVVFIALLLIPYLPDRIKWIREFKRKLRHVLREEADNADKPE